MLTGHMHGARAFDGLVAGTFGTRAVGYALGKSIAPDILLGLVITAARRTFSREEPEPRGPLVKAFHINGGPSKPSIILRNAMEPYLAEPKFKRVPFTYALRGAAQDYLSERMEITAALSRLRSSWENSPSREERALLSAFAPFCLRPPPDYLPPLQRARLRAETHNQ